MKPTSIFSLLFFAPYAAFANDATSSYTGFYAGIGVGQGEIEDPYYELRRRDGLPNGWSGEHNDTSNLISLALGHNWKNDNLILGLEARIQKRNFNAHSFQIDNTGNVDTDNFTTYESDLSKQLVFKIGTLLDAKNHVYLSIGRVETDYTRTYTTTDLFDASDSIKSSEYGNLFGVGYETFISDNLSIRGEINRIRYDKTVNNPASWARIDDHHEATENTLLITLSHYF